jgi:hypothetical protein
MGVFNEAAGVSLKFSGRFFSVKAAEDRRIHHASAWNGHIELCASFWSTPVPKRFESSTKTSGISGIIWKRRG